MVKSGLADIIETILQFSPTSDTENDIQSDKDFKSRLKRYEEIHRNINIF